MLNTEIIIHPKLNHVGLTTDNLEPLIDWYRKILV
jgi:catechol 2,3-dioxygenase